MISFVARLWPSMNDDAVESVVYVYPEKLSAFWDCPTKNILGLITDRGAETVYSVEPSERARVIAELVHYQHLL